MLVKTDTKEKFHVITLAEPHISATMTDELEKCLNIYLQNDVHQPVSQTKNLIVKMNEVESLDLAVAQMLSDLQQLFYEQNASFVVCELKKPVEDFLDKNELLELMNVTPTESEAWDIVQMEEIERELMNGDFDEA